MVVEVKALTEERADIEWRKCKRSLMYYLCNYVWVEDRVRQGIYHWLRWEHLEQLVGLIQGWRDAPVRMPLAVMIFKSRQVGATTTICGIASWLVHFHQSTKVEYQSEKMDVALEMLDRNIFISEHHPEFLRLTRSPDRQVGSKIDTLGFPATGGRMVAMPSTESAGRTSDAPCGCKFCLGIYADSELVGVMIFGHPIARMEEQDNTLELTRMFLFDSPKNSESKALSLAEKWIKRNRTERRLIAYSDTAEGHTGTIYRAANWKMI